MQKFAFAKRCQCLHRVSVPKLYYTPPSSRIIAGRQPRNNELAVHRRSERRGCSSRRDKQLRNGLFKKGSNTACAYLCNGLVQTLVATSV